MHRLSLGLLSLCGLAACWGSPDPVPARPPVPEGVSGLLSLADGALQFQPCDAPGPTPLRDGTDRDLFALVQELGYGAGSIHAHLVLDGSMVRELRIAAPESRGCADLLPDGAFQARGNEPFWAVTIEGTTAIWRTPEEPEGIGFEDGQWSKIQAGWQFETAPPDALVVVFLDVPCIDTMSGARYPFTATASLEGWRVEGCGMEGRDVTQE